MTCILGIDPGISGAVAFYFPQEGRVSVYDTPVAGNQVDGAGLAHLINKYNPDVAMIEAVHSMPGQGVSSTFKFGMAYGIAIGTVAASMIPYHLVSPARWKKHFHLTSDKDQSRALAIQFWPENKNFGRKKDNGRAEAALLARFCFETIKIIG